MHGFEQTNPPTNVNKPMGRIFRENLRTGMSPANNAMESYGHRRREGSTLTNSALEAADGDSGT